MGVKAFPMTAYLVGKGLFRDNPFALVDAGCRGGIEECWRVFGDDLRAMGIDPMVAEIKRLQSAETNPNVKYVAGFVGLPNDHPMVQSREGRGPWGNNPWHRLSTAWAKTLMAGRVSNLESLSKDNRWREKELAEGSRRLGLSTLVVENQMETVDFIKIDIDGDDLYALCSCEEIIESHDVLGFKLEVNFFGTDCETDNTFHNTDRYMRRQGFDLVDLTVRKYSRRALPAPFAQPKPAGGIWGVPYQGDAVYVRDLARSPADCSMAVVKILKLAAIYEVCGLPDCAAEVLQAFREQLSEVVDVDRALDLITPRHKGKKMSYQQYIESFSADPTSFYPRQRSGIEKSMRVVTARVKALVRRCMS